MPKLIKLSFTILSILLAFFVIDPALAGSPLDGYTFENFDGENPQSDGLLPTAHGPKCPDGSPNCGNYTLNDMVGLVLKISEFILGLVGSLALLAFVYGGIMWIISAGNAERVDIGKKAIIGAVVGLAIVFTSFMIIQLVYSALGIPRADKGEWSVSSWTSGWSK
ncbi:MAG: pilin [bacterium]|nr:pilin [bacterium]